MTRIPAPVLFALAILILWPAAQVATLLLLRMRVQDLAIRAIAHFGQTQISAAHVPVWAKVLSGALLASCFAIASRHQVETFLKTLEKGLN